jgi:hypothetical protein
MTIALYPITNGTIADADGYFEIAGNFTSVFQSGSPLGFPFVAVDSNGSPATVQSAISTTVLSSTFVGGYTRIVPDDGSGTPLVIPAPNGSYVTIAGGAYSLDRTDGNPPIVVTPGSIESSSTSLAFPGRAALNVGEHFNENMLHLLENFAAVSAPSAPIDGQLWYDISDASNKDIKVYNEDTATWSPVGNNGANYDEIVAGASSTITLTNVTAATKTSVKAFQQVFVNGALQRESSGSPGSGVYFVEGPSTLKFNPGVINGGDVILVYQI